MEGERSIMSKRVCNQVDDLLLAADVMRLTGHSKRAAPYLKRVVGGFSRDPRSASAAFALGKVYLDELEQPRQAAGVFRLYLGITPEGGRAERPLGDATLFSLSDVFTLGVGDRLFSLPLIAGVAIGFRGGFGRLHGRPFSPAATGGTLSGGVGGPLVQLSLSSATRLAAGLAVEMGYALFGSAAVSTWGGRWR
jgi:hypothetical protein